MPKILLGVSGGIAAYKSCELLRELRRRGCEVRVMMTEAAQHFVTKLTFEALTQSPVLTDMFNDQASGTSHIDAARWADTIVIAPATADLIGRMAQGIANDAVSTIYLAFRGRVVVAPAMNTAMWEHPAFRSNLKTLQSRSVETVSPVASDLACGEVGVGKMAEPKTIADFLLGEERPSKLLDKEVLITAGATREYIDPVRYISSPSTGKMGLAIAKEAVRRGANVTVVHGVLSQEPDFKARFLPVTSAGEMLDAISTITPTEIFVGTAAVADFQPTTTSKQKIKKQNELIRLECEPTVDILATISKKRRPGDLLVGFAAETENVVANAKMKRESKGLDLIVANEVDREKKGFAQEQTSVVLIDRQKEERLENISKTDVAKKLWDRLEELL